ncbi:MAG: ATP synthase F1 subunit gamma [Candidatus Spechtbacterales bacterium]|nr:ATP synthase F1 subunit gamma [Candidatus Spechtbacterales bacterium]
MALQAKQIKNQIQAIGNIKKITKAMEMVAATKMRKATEAAVSSREYARISYEVLVNLGKQKDIRHPFLEERNNNKTLLVMFSANRGLCGSFNALNNKNVSEYYSQNNKNKFDFIAVGKKAAHHVKKLDGEILASFTDYPDIAHIDDTWPIAKMIIQEFEKESYGNIVLAYTHFKSALSSSPVIKQLLPVDSSEVERLLKDIYEQEGETAFPGSGYKFEPTEEEALDFVLRRVIEVQVYQTLLESQASEHSSRMIAMKNASENADKLSEDLTLWYNRARQDQITQEIAEIAGGAQALNS